MKEIVLAVDLSNVSLDDLNGNVPVRVSLISKPNETKPLSPEHTRAIMAYVLSLCLDRLSEGGECANGPDCPNCHPEKAPEGMDPSLPIMKMPKGFM